MKLEQQLRNKIRSQGKADSTADAYWYWVNRFLRFAKEKRGEWVDPKSMGRRQVEIFLSHLANKEDVSPNTQNQAFAALCYLYRDVLGQPLENVKALRAKRPQTIRDVVDESEIIRLFEELSGTAKLAAMMMYASSFRIGEIGRLRIKDISFERKQIAIRNAKGEKARVVGFTDCLHEPIQRQIESMKVLWRSDCADGLNGVSLPHAFGRKSPGAHREWAWWYLFAADQYSRDPVSGKLYRHHVDTGHIARQIKQAAIRAEIPKRITSHCLRHSWATHSLENNVPIHIVQALAGHASMETTAGYIHVKKDGATAAKSPLETLLANPQLAQSRPQPGEVFRPRLWTGTDR
jgi:integron integrase